MNVPISIKLKDNYSYYDTEIYVGLYSKSIDLEISELDTEISISISIEQLEKILAEHKKKHN